MNRTDMCIKLSEDYADRAARGGANYDDSYSGYLARCSGRDTVELRKQIETAELGMSKLQFIRV